MKVIVEVISKVILEIEAESREDAVVTACETAWEYDPDEQVARILAVEVPAREAIAMFEQAEREDTDPERNALRQKLKSICRE